MGDHNNLRNIVFQNRRQRSSAHIRPNWYRIPFDASWTSKSLFIKAISIPFVTRYAKKVSSGMTCFVSGIAMSFIMYFASYTQSFSTFAALFGLGNGIIIGIIYILPIGHCYQFFPKNKTMISIFIISASGIGTLLFSYIALNTINFDNISLEAGGVNLFYGKEVAERFP